MQPWEPAADIFDVAFEVLHVDCVEPDDGRVQSDVGLGNV